jgi:hypothetical protein
VVFWGRIGEKIRNINIIIDNDVNDNDLKYFFYYKIVPKILP